MQKNMIIISVTKQQVISTDAIKAPFDTSEEALNNIKAQMPKHSGRYDIYRYLYKKIKALGAQCISNAWYKFAEILKIIPEHIGRKIIPECGDFNVFMNAELPGAALCAVNHIVKTQYPNVSFNWLASSFKPSKDGTQLTDSFGLVECNPSRWLIGSSKEYTGDMTDPAQVGMAVKMYKDRCNSCHLYTSDAGLDAEKDVGPWTAYVDQERMTIKLHLGCLIAGLEVLSPGGSLICKQYTLFEENTKRLINYCSMFFEEVLLVKPVTSRPCNSEVYMIGLGFRPPEDHNLVLSEMYDAMNQSPLDLSSKSPRQYFLARSPSDTIRESITMFNDIIIGRQITFIEEMIVMSGRGTKICDKIYDSAMSSWLSKVKLKSIDPVDLISSTNH